LEAINGIPDASARSRKIFRALFFKKALLVTSLARDGPFPRRLLYALP
jgi:hypothetical protein